jgi:hypothetical protein
MSKNHIPDFESFINEDSINEGADTWVIYVENESDGKKTKVNEVPRAKLNTTLNNIGARYADNDVIVAAMTSADWEKINKK